MNNRDFNELISKTCKSCAKKMRSSDINYIKYDRNYLFKSLQNLNICDKCLDVYLRIILDMKYETK